MISRHPFIFNVIYVNDGIEIVLDLMSNGISHIRSLLNVLCDAICTFKFRFCNIIYIHGSNDHFNLLNFRITAKYKKPHN